MALRVWPRRKSSSRALGRGRRSPGVSAEIFADRFRMSSTGRSAAPASAYPASEDRANENETESADSDGSLAVSAAEKASDAALAAVGGGTVLEVEAADDGGSAYEVEIRKSDGTLVEVLIDSRFHAVKIVGGG
jgi:hypothetical protein